MEQGELHLSYINILLGLLFVTVEKSTQLDLPLISWILLLLSNTVDREASSSVVHIGSKCSNCGISPIHGVRFRYKLSKVNN
jgi:hypothetical protein